jgi:putative ATP-dependent endonuclease of OLD family
MYISKIRIKNYRCFENLCIEFNRGINVIIGENNSGKTALIKALGLIFDRRSRTSPQLYDFYQGIVDVSEPPRISVTVTLASSPKDGVEDKALVATWLTKLESPWEAQLSYQFFLADEAIEEFKREISNLPEEEKRDGFWKAVQRFLPKHVSRIYGGPLEAQVRAEPEFLNKFDYQFLDAIRDVESELFSGSNPMLRTMLQQVLDVDAEDSVRLQRESDFFNRSQDLSQSLITRLDLPTLTELVDKTGADDGGTPTLSGNLTENDLITALRLFIDREGLSLPANYNGLGYNNLIYISLVLASLKFKSSVQRRGPNAVLFPVLLIEEPEAHLHPSLQYKLLKYIRDRVDRTDDSRQVFLTSHSTHITSASELDSIICMSAPTRELGVRVSYPGRVFADNPEGRASKKYMERFLDATKSNMLFAKGIIFVEGIAEQLLIPCLAEYIGAPLEEKHVAVIAVGGSTFKHFLPIFGATTAQETRRYAIDRPVSCIVDGDPMLRRNNQSRRTRCWPYQIDYSCGAANCYGVSRIQDQTQFFPVSSIVKNLEKTSHECPNIRISFGPKTLEYDLAAVNVCSTMLTAAIPTEFREKLSDMANNADVQHMELQGLLDEDTLTALAFLNEDPDTKKAAAFATYYLACVKENKGEHAFDLAHILKDNLLKPESERNSLKIPTHVEEAISWARRAESGEANSYSVAH